jgi:arylsulfatase A-like enzyme
VSAQLVAWIALAVTSALTIAVTARWPEGGVTTRLVQHAFDLGHLVAMGLVAAGGVLVWRRFGPRRLALVWAVAAIVVLAAAIGWLVVAEDLRNAAERMAGEEKDPTLHLVALTVAACAPIPIAFVAGRLLARPRFRLRLVALAAAIAAVAANHLILAGAYPGLHVVALVCAGLLAGAALPGAAIPRFVPRLSRRRARVAAIAALVASSAPTLILWPDNQTAIEILDRPGTVLAPYLAQAHAGSLHGEPITGPDAEWYEPRSGRPSIPASTPPLLHDDAIVLLLGIDAVRADVFHKQARRDMFPSLSRLREESVRFEDARAAGSQTVYTVTAMMTGKHYSQQYWTVRSTKPGSQYWPYDDPTIQFPKLLSLAGVKTVNFATLWWMSARAGVAEGFKEDKRVATKTKFKENLPTATEVMDPILARLERYDGGRLFVYTHFMDPHWPYRAKKSGRPWEKYLAEIQLVDVEIGRLVAFLKERGLWDKTTIIIMSDHGEAFGEHGITQHAKTLYEELLQVPLWIRTPGVTPREVREPVSTMDLGPTILDLFGQPTPGHWIGQSLVPFLRGQDPRLTRPIIAEGRLMQALVTRERIKAIRDVRLGTHEAYDLDRDPDEKRNIYGRPEAYDAMNRLRRFFDVHTNHENGYSPPWRR